MIVALILLKNINFCAQKNNLHKSQKRAFALIFLHKIDIQIAHVVLIFQNFWSYRSIQNSQIATDCYVLTDSVFFALCACFDGSMVFFYEFLP